MRGGAAVATYFFETITAAQAASRRQPQPIDIMWCNDAWSPKLCVGRATAGVFLATDEDREWALNFHQS